MRGLFGKGDPFRPVLNRVPLSYAKLISTVLSPVTYSCDSDRVGKLTPSKGLSSKIVQLLTTDPASSTTVSFVGEAAAEIAVIVSAVSPL